MTNVNGGITPRELEIKLEEQDKRTNLKFAAVTQEFTSLAKAVDLQRLEYREANDRSGLLVTRMTAFVSLVLAFAAIIINVVNH